MQKADDKCYYVLTLRGDLGPFDRATLLEQLHSGAVQATDQVRNAFGRTQGTVNEALDLPRDRPSGALRRTAPGKAPETGRTGSGRTAARGSQTGRRIPPPPSPRRRVLLVLVIAGALLLLLVVATVSAGSRSPDGPVRQASASMAVKIRSDLSAAPAVPVARSPAPAFIPSPASRLVIVKAVYGVLPNGPSKDVTASVRSAMKDGQLSLWAYNGRFGDPAHHMRKDLLVIYTWDGVERSKTVSEYTQMTISDQGR